MTSASSFMCVILLFLVACFWNRSWSTPPSVTNTLGKFADWKPPARTTRTIASNALEKTFNEALKNATEGEVGIRAIEAAMAATYYSLPKNSYGLLSHSAGTYLVQKYFSQVHRMSIHGLGHESAYQHSSNPPMLGASILQDQAPDAVETLLEARRSGHGLTLGDAATVAAILHSLTMGHVVTLAGDAMNALDQVDEFPTDGFQRQDLIRFAHAWAYLSKYNMTMNLAGFKARLEKPSHLMKLFADLMTNIAATKDFNQRYQRNPFVDRGFSEMDTVGMAMEVVEEMGRWQTDDCKDIKNHLVNLDFSETGRVPLEVLYNQPPMEDEIGSGLFRFSESIDYLREVGALDETDIGTPKVLISNYMLGPANCYRISSYFTYCCLSECDSFMNEIERYVQGPTATPELLIDLVVNITTDFMDEPPSVSDMMQEKLISIAARHAGRVPLHGRLFAQWLHFLLPHECPYPHMADKDAAGTSLLTSYLQRTGLSRGASATQDDSNSTLTQWTDDELLPFDATEERVPGRRSVANGVVVLAVLAALGSLAWSHAKSALRSMNKDIGTHKWDLADKLV